MDKSCHQFCAQKQNGLGLRVSSIWDDVNSEKRHSAKKAEATERKDVTHCAKMEARDLVKVPDSSAKHAHWSAKDTDSIAKVPDSAAKVADSAAEVRDSAAEVPNSTAKVAHSAAKIAHSVAKVAVSVAKVADSAAKVAHSAAKDPGGPAAAAKSDSAPRPRPRVACLRHRERARRGACPLDSRSRYSACATLFAAWRPAL